MGVEFEQRNVSAAGFRLARRVCPAILLAVAFSWSALSRPVFAELGAGNRPASPTAKTTARDAFPPELTVRVYNYAHIDSGLLSRSEDVATAIFEDVGVRVAWLDCPLSPELLGAYPACQSHAGAADLALRILPRNMAGKLAMPDEPLGFAYPCPEDEPACVLNIFYYRVDELAADGYRADRLLAYAIAHEVAHALIGPGHSEEGIMRGQWSSRDLERICWGLPPHFTGNQPAALRSAVLRRMKLVQRFAEGGG